MKQVRYAWDMHSSEAKCDEYCVEVHEQVKPKIAEYSGTLPGKSDPVFNICYTSSACTGSDMFHAVFESCHFKWFIVNFASLPPHEFAHARTWWCPTDKSTCIGNK